MLLAERRRAARAYIETDGSTDVSVDTQGGFLDIQYPAVISLRGYMDELDLSRPSEDMQRGGDLSLCLENAVLLLDLIKARYVGRSLQMAEFEDCLELLRYFTQAVLPLEAFALVNESHSGVNRKLDAGATANFHAFTYHGLVCLSFLWPVIADMASDEAKMSLCASLAIFCNPEDPWTSLPTCAKSVEILRLMGAQLLLDNTQTCIYLLRERIKPAFQGTGTSKLTSQAHRAPQQIPLFTSSLLEDAESKSWKHENVYAPTLLRYVLLQLDALGSSFIESNWPLLIPPILAMIDDLSAIHKAEGCHNLEILLLQNPAVILERTGLGEIFEDAVLPCLTYLPPHTEESKSIALLARAYPALIELAAVRYFKPEQRLQRLKSLSTIMRAGICKSFVNAGENVRVAQTLFVQMKSLVQRLDTDVIKHLKHMMQICCSTLADPFSASCHSLTIACVETLQQIIVLTWPRLGVYKFELLRALRASSSKIDSEVSDSKEEKLLYSGIVSCHRLLGAPAKPFEAEQYPWPTALA